LSTISGVGGDGPLVYTRLIVRGLPESKSFTDASLRGLFAKIDGINARHTPASDRVDVF
jgi:hypothetical protein